MSEIYIQELGKYVNRNEAIEYFRKKSMEEKLKNDIQYLKVEELVKKNDRLFEVVKEISYKLDKIIALLGGEKISIENNLKNMLSENSTK